MITNYWAKVHDQHGRPKTPTHDRLQNIEELGPSLTTGQREEYRNAQRALWLEQRELGVPWLVSDFISVGSPLSHADWLMTSGRHPLGQCFERREILSNPPQPDRPDSDSPYSYTLDGTRDLFVLHNAAAFACTRWTNIWFPTKAGLFGDPFGGPVARLFGAGVADRPVTGGSRWPRRVPVLAHVKYWRNPGCQNLADGDHIRLLREALDLDSRDWLNDLASTRGNRRSAWRGDRVRTLSAKGRAVQPPTGRRGRASG